MMMLFAMNARRELPAAIHRRKRKRRGMQARRDRQQDQNPANFKTRIAKSPESSNEIRSLGNDFAHSHEGALIGEVFVAV
jgi:hypothetical protein